MDKKKGKTFQSKLLLFICCLFLLACFPNSALTQDSPSKIDKSEVFKKREQQDAVFQELQSFGYEGAAQAIKEDIKSDQAYLEWYKQGKDFFHKGLHKEALAEFKKVIDWNPQYKPAVNYIQIIEKRIAREQTIEDSKRLAEDKIRQAKEKRENIEKAKVQRKEELAQSKKKKAEEAAKAREKRAEELTRSKKEKEEASAQAELKRKESLAEKKAKEEIEAIYKNNLRQEQVNLLKEKQFKKVNEDKVKDGLTVKIKEEKLAERKQNELASQQYDFSLKQAEKIKLEDLSRGKEEKKQEIIASKEKIINYKRDLSDKISAEKPDKIKAQEVTLMKESSASVVYRIDREDGLKIDVWGYPPLSREVIVRSDGMITMPFLGDIQAGGLTTLELREKITLGLVEYSRNKLKTLVSEKPGDETEYLVGPGDVLDISVWKIPDLTIREIVVRPDGKISFPLIGELKVTGLSLTRLNQELTKALKSYIVNPQVSVMTRSLNIKRFDAGPPMPTLSFLNEKPDVTVTISKFGSRKIIILGEVSRPGVYSFVGDIRLIEAVALAGDCTKYAVKNNLLVIRGDLHNKPQVIISNISAILKNAKLSQNVLIQPHDIIYVPRTIIGNINTFLDIIAPVVDSVYKGTVIDNSLNN